jgi:putative transposase
VGQATRERRGELIDADHERLSVRRQCALLQINRSTIYYKEKEVGIDEITLLNEIRDIWQRYPFYGYRRVTKELQFKGYTVNHKRVQRLMREGGIKALYPGPNTSRRNRLHAVHPYLLKDLEVKMPNQAWMVDITYLRMNGGFVYLVAFIDVHSRYIVSWELSNTLDTAFCLEALRAGLAENTPLILNSDQGCQFTSEPWIASLRDNNIKISMTGKGRCLDNVYIERFWRSFKREEFYLNSYDSIRALKKAIAVYIDFYNNRRWHQSLEYKTPANVYFNEAPAAVA